jgi:hypothetical protein
MRRPAEEGGSRTVVAPLEEGVLHGAGLWNPQLISGRRFRIMEKKSVQVNDLAKRLLSVCMVFMFALSLGVEPDVGQNQLDLRRPSPDAHGTNVREQSGVDIGINVLERKGGVGQHVAPQVSVSREEKIHPHRRVRAGPRFEVLRVTVKGHDEEQEHRKEERGGEAERNAPPHGAASAFMSCKPDIVLPLWSSHPPQREAGILL